jgi:hypothetical protein
MRHGCELATLMAAARRPIQAELWDDVRAHFPLVVNAYEPHLASLNDNEPAGRCYSQRPAARSQDAPVEDDVAEVPFVGERHKLVLSTPIWGGHRVPCPGVPSGGAWKLAPSPGTSSTSCVAVGHYSSITFQRTFVETLAIAR